MKGSKSRSSHRKAFRTLFRKGVKKQGKAMPIPKYGLVGVAIALFVISFVLLVWPAGAQKTVVTTATPIVSATPEGEILPVFGFSAECPGIKLSVFTDAPFHGDYTARCGSPENPSEILYVVYSCVESTGLVQAWEKGDFSGFTEVTVQVVCQGGKPETWDQTECVSPTGNVFVNTPVYGDRHAFVTCS